MATRTRLAHFKVGQAEGTVHFGDESWLIAAGVVECPLEVGENAGWAAATPDDVKAFEKAKAKADKK